MHQRRNQVNNFAGQDIERQYYNIHGRDMIRASVENNAKYSESTYLEYIQKMTFELKQTQDKLAKSEELVRMYGNTVTSTEESLGRVLKDSYELHKTNCHLKDENAQLRKENERIKKENEKLKRESSKKETDLLYFQKLVDDFGEQAFRANTDLNSLYQANYFMSYQIGQWEQWATENFGYNLGYQEISVDEFQTPNQPILNVQHIPIAYWEWPENETTIAEVNMDSPNTDQVCRKLSFNDSVTKDNGRLERQKKFNELLRQADVLETTQSVAKIEELSESFDRTPN